MRKFIVFLFLSTFFLLTGVANAYDPGGYDVQTHLTPPEEVGPIKDATKNTKDDQFATVTQRCEATSIPSNYDSVCCQPPYYWLNPVCPYQMKGQDLVYDPSKQLQTEEENDAYQATLACLGSSGGDCSNSPAVQNILQNAKNKYNTCKNDCENSYQGCVPGCNVQGTSNGGGPYVDGNANYYYFAVVSCLQAGGNCLRVAPTQYHDVVVKAMDDVRYGTVWQAQQTEGYVDQNCQSSCVSNRDYCTSNCDQQYKDLPDRIRAAAQKAVDNWETVGNLGSSKIALPPPTPVNNELQKIEDKATWPNLDKITDPNGKEIMAQDILRGGLSDDMPIATFKYPVENFKKGEPVAITVSGGPGETLPIQEVVLTPAKDAGSGSVEITVSGGTTPKLLGEGALGTPDYVLPAITPDPQIYDLDSYVRIGATTQIIDKADPIRIACSDTYIRFAINTSNYKATNGKIVSMLHYNEKSKNWDELSVEKYLCEYDTGWCRYTAHSTGNSIFAIVVKKASETKSDTNIDVNNDKNALTLNTNPAPVSNWIALAVWFVLIVVFYRKFWGETSAKLKSASNRKQKRNILHEYGFFKYIIVFGGVLIGNSICMLLVFLRLPNNTIELKDFFAVYCVMFVAGMIVGVVGWLAQTIHFKE